MKVDRAIAVIVLVLMLAADAASTQLWFPEGTVAGFLVLLAGLNITGVLVVSSLWRG